MSDIQRYYASGRVVGDGYGPYVEHSDHVEALRQARHDERLAGFAGEPFAAAYAEGRRQGQRDALAAATERVEVWAARSAYGLQAWDGLFRAIKGDSDD